MCFSAPVSFAVGGPLMAAGVWTLTRAGSARALPLASMPLLFGLHQMVEGLLWLELENAAEGPVRSPLVDAYVLFALVILPVLVPTAISLVEPRTIPRRIMQLFIAWSAGVGLYLLTGMLVEPYAAQVHEGNIRYESRFEFFDGIEYLYAAGVTVPLLLSRHRALVALGLVVAATLTLTKVFFPITYVSVWCHLAAIASLIIVAHFAFRNDRRTG